MRAVYLTGDQADELLARIAAELPPSFSMGKPVLAYGRQVVVDVDDGAVFEWERDGSVSRVAVLPGRKVEVCSWRGGVETVRYLARVGGLD